MIKPCKMKKTRLSSNGFFLLIIFLFSTASCDWEVSEGGISHSKGASSEILVVTDNKEHWKSSIGDTIMSFFYQYIEALPQPEPMFNLVNIPQQAFSKMYKSHRSIFIVDIDSSFKNPLIESKKDLWAKPQQVIKITAPDKQSFFEEFNKYKESFLKKYIAVEHERILNAFRSTENSKVINKLQKKFGFYMTIPGGFKVAKSAKNFMWIKKETLTYSQGLLIHSEPYTDTGQFNPDYIIKRRNLITKAFVPGPTDSSWMSTDMKYVLPVHEEMNFKKMYAVETRGLWIVENDFMGGPFVSYTFAKGDRIYTVEAYVYAPAEEKRDYMRQMEAVLHSLRFVEDQG